MSIRLKNYKKRIKKINKNYTVMLFLNSKVNIVFFLMAFYDLVKLADNKNLYVLIAASQKKYSNK